MLIDRKTSHWFSLFVVGEKTQTSMKKKTWEQKNAESKIGKETTRLPYNMSMELQADNTKERGVKQWHLLPLL